MSEERPFNRRNFFRQGMKELLRPLQNMAGPLEEVIKQLGALDGEAAPNPPAKERGPFVPTEAGKMVGIPVRPPGALPEQEFRDTCSKCRECVRVCPVQCIKIDSTGVKSSGAPYIDIDSAACVLCDGLLCMNTCPSGALVPTAVGDIDMGTAIWHEETCVRTAGEACTTCIDACPIGEMAIVLEGNKIKVIADGCTGCGMCQNRCPTRPRSIVVKPKYSAPNASLVRGRPR